MPGEDKAKDEGRETEEEPPRKKNKESQQNVNVTGVAGGTVSTANIAGIVYGGMGNKIVNEPDQQKKLFERTKKEIDLKIAGMIRVSAVDLVVRKMNEGQHWITITGNAGDGKTTLGYLVLKEFLQKDVKVFTIYKPEEYDLIADMAEDRVIMFDDRFGAFLADQRLINNWLDVIRKLFNFRENDQPKVYVIFVSRKNVVNESRMNLGQLTENMFDLNCVFDLSERNIPEERLNILEYHLQREHVTVDHKLKIKVAHKDIAHGFPHCCKLYSMLRKNFKVDIEEFFESPLKFLDWTTNVLYKNNCRDLFQMMIKNDGEFDVYTIEDEHRRHALLQVEKEQEGSYITVWRNGTCEFAHPSVYESVLNVINDIDPLYCVQYATLSVIRQKMLISTSDEEDKHRSPCYIIVKPIPKVLTVLAERFIEDILEGDYSVFKHRLCKDRRFCEALVSCLINTDQGENSSTLVINKRDEDGETMLWTALKSGNITAVCALMSAGACVHEEHDKYGKTPLHYFCQEEIFTTDDVSNPQLDVTDSIQMIITTERGCDVNICDKVGRKPLHYLLKHHTLHQEKIQFVINVLKSDVNLGDSHGRTPLHYLCRHERINVDLLKLMITKSGNVNQPDIYGSIPLHYLCSRRNISADLLKVMITEGKGNLNHCEQNMSTPLHYLCSYSDIQMDTADLVIREGKGNFNKGDEHGSTPLHYLCANEQVELVVLLRVLKTGKGDINKQDTTGITPLHVFCMRHKLTDIISLIQQVRADINLSDSNGNTPFHYLCRRGITRVWISHSQAGDISKVNGLGYTSLDYLKDQDGLLPWTEGIVMRSAADLVICSRRDGDKSIVVLAPAMTLSSERVYEYYQVEDFSQELTDMARSGDRDRPGRFRVFLGTCSSPVPVPPSPSPFCLPTYWETHTRHTWRKRVGPLLEIGVVEGEDHLDEQVCVSNLPGSVCVFVEEDCPRHRGRLCIKVLREDQEDRGDQEDCLDWVDKEDGRDQVGECVTLPRPTRGEEFTFKLGLVLDVGRGRVGFIDVERGEILGKVDRKFTEWVFPMFCIGLSIFGHCPTRMRLVSGREISINDRKIQLIQQVLSD